MNYIILDMEWNQPGYADTALCRNGVCMKNEIIQIGAVKLDENGKWKKELMKSYEVDVDDGEEFIILRQSDITTFWCNNIKTA